MDRDIEERFHRRILGIANLFNFAWEEGKTDDFMDMQTNIIKFAIDVQRFAGGKRENFIDIVNDLYDLAEKENERRNYNR